MRELINWSIEQGGDAPRLLAPGKPAYQPPAPAADIPSHEEDAETLDASIEQATAEPEAPKPRKRRGRPKGATKKTTKKTPKKTTGGKRGRPKTTKAKATVSKDVEDIEEVIDASRIVEVAKNSDRFRKIKKDILDKSNQLNRILLAFHYARATYGDRGFSSGTIEQVTKEFGKMIRRSNIAAQIKNQPHLFDADQTPRPGITVKYELTPAGRNRIEELIKK